MARELMQRGPLELRGALLLYSLEVYQGLLFWLFRGGFKVNSGTLKWYRSSYGTDSDSSDTVGPVYDTRTISGIWEWAGKL